MEFDRANEMILYHHAKLLSDYLDIEKYPYIHLFRHKKPGPLGQVRVLWLCQKN